MKNTLDVFSDDITIYATFSIKTNWLFKGILIAIILPILSLLIMGFYFVDPHYIGQFLIAFAFVFFFMVFLPIKYLLWNMYGQERLVITTKAIAISRSFGFWETKQQVIKYNTLRYNIESTQFFDNVEFGKVYFFDTKLETDFQSVIYESNVWAPITSLNKLIEEIANMNLKKQESEFWKVSLN